MITELTTTDPTRIIEIETRFGHSKTYTTIIRMVEVRGVLRSYTPTHNKYIFHDFGNRRSEIKIQKFHAEVFLDKSFSEKLRSLLKEYNCSLTDNAMATLTANGYHTV